VSSVLSVVESFFSPGAWARAACACRSSAVEPRGGMSMGGGRMTGFSVQFICNSCAITARKINLRQTLLKEGGEMSMEGGRMSEIGEMLQQRHGTRMTRIGRIFTDIFNPWVSASSAQSVSYRIPPIIYDDKKPQMNADERRYVQAADFGEIIHRKERKAAQQEPLCSLCPLWLNVFSAQAHERAPPAPAVHLRLSRVGG